MKSRSLIKASIASRQLHIESRALLETEIYSPYYLQKRQELLLQADKPEQKGLHRKQFEQKMQELESKRQELETWPESKKYAEHE